MKKLISLCLAFALTLTALGISVLAEETQTETEAVPRLEKFYPIADAGIDGKEKDKTTGSDAKLVITGNNLGGYKRFAFFKYDLTQVRDNISKATFTVAIPEAYSYENGVVLSVFASDHNDWEEGTLTYNNANAEDLALIENADNAIATMPVGKHYLKTADITQTIKDAKQAGKEQITLIVRSTTATNKNAGVHLSTKEAAVGIENAGIRYDGRPTLMVTNVDTEPETLKSGVPVTPTEDAAVDANNSNKDSALAGLEQAGISGPVSGSGYKRYYFMKFDLQGAQGRKIKKATLSLTSATVAAAASSHGIYATDNTGWDANGLTSSNMGTLPEFLDVAGNQIASAAGWDINTTKTFDITNYIKEKLAAEQYQFTLGLRNIDEGIDNAYQTFWTAWASEAEKRPGITILFADEPMEVTENQPLYPADDAGISGAAPEESSPEAAEAPVGGENYFFAKLDLRELQQEAGNIQMAVTGKTDSDGAYGVYLLPGADWDEYSLTYNNAPLSVFDEEPAAIFRYPRAGVERKLDITDTVLPLLQAGERMFTVAIKRIDSGQDEFSVYTRDADSGAPYFLVGYKKTPGQVPPIENLSGIVPIDDIALDGNNANKDNCLKGAEQFTITGTLQNRGYMRHYVMKFDFSGIPGRIKKATLKLNVESAYPAAEFGVYVSDNNEWTSEGATYNNFNKNFLQGKDNMAATFGNVRAGDSIAVDVTDAISKGMANGSKIVTLGIRNVNDTRFDGDNNLTTVFYSAQAAESKRLCLAVELYDEAQPVTVGAAALRSGNTGIGALQPGVVTVRTNIGCTRETGSGEKIHVIFALCRGTEEAYRVVDLQEQDKHIYDVAGSNLEADFRVEEGDFVKVFVWNGEGTHMIGQPSITIR